MNDTIATLITWTTYGAWLPGDSRGWRKRNSGPQNPKPSLAAWCGKQMTGEAVLLRPDDRAIVEQACQGHCDYRGWHLFAVSARSNHVHVVVAADEKSQKVRDQLKANCTRELRTHDKSRRFERVWTKGGDCEILKTDDDIFNAVVYVADAQDRKGRDIGSHTDFDAAS